MRNLLSLVGLVVVVFLGLGWYLGWYTFKVAPGSDGGYQFQGDVKAKKIGEDVNQAREKVGKILTSDPKAAAVEHPDGLMGPPLPPNFQPPKSQPTGSH